MDAKFDIFRKLPNGHPVWVKAVSGLEQAKQELLQLALQSPAEYFIYDTRIGRAISAEAKAMVAAKTLLGLNLTD